VIRRNWILQIW